MKDFVFGSYKMRVDVARTRRHYSGRPAPWIGCDCAGCRNFARAVGTLPQAVADFFRALGVDPRQPAETCHYYAADADSVFSSAWYHVAGELAAGDPAPGSGMRYGAEFGICDGVSVSAATECDLLPDDFPRPCFQIELWLYRLPWLLDEPNPYFSGQEKRV